MKRHPEPELAEVKDLLYFRRPFALLRVTVDEFCQWCRRTKEESPVIPSPPLADQGDVPKDVIPYL